MFLVLGCSSGSVVGLHSRYSFENGKGVDKIGYAIDSVRRVRSSPARTVGVVGRWFIGLSQSIYPKSLPYASYNRFSCALLISFSILNPNLQLSSRKTLSQYLFNSDFMLTSEMKLIRPKAERRVHWHENQAK